MLCYNMVKLSERRVIMIQTTVQVSGMVCSMCEAHVNDAVRSALNVKKVTSSHAKGETVSKPHIGKADSENRCRLCLSIAHTELQLGSI